MKRPTHSDKRRQIIASTIKLLRKTGFEKVSVRAICQNADISIGTFYHYFRDKDDLLRAVLGGIDEYLLNEIQPRLASDSQLENLRTFALSFADSTVSTGSVYGSIISSTNVPLPASPEDRAREHARPLYSIPRGILLEGQRTGEFRADFDADFVTDSLILFLRGCAMDWARRSFSYDLRVSINRTFDTFSSFLTGSGTQQ